MTKKGEKVESLFVDFDEKRLLDIVHVATRRV